MKKIEIEQTKKKNGVVCFVVRLEDGRLLDDGAPFPSRECAQRRVDYLNMFRGNNK